MKTSMGGREKFVVNCHPNGGNSRFSRAST